MRTFAILAISTLLGCASGTVPPLEAGHPASPSASEGVAAAELPAEHAHGAAESSPPAEGGYSCPMHPEVTSDKPGQQCPKCGMNLVPVKKDAP